MRMVMKLTRVLLSFLLLTLSASSFADVSPRVIERTFPLYPVEAAAKGMDADVKIKFDVDKNGRVLNPEIISVSPNDAKGVFDSQIFHALKKWRYERGKPAKNVVTMLRFRINLPQGNQ
ncbi:TonB family protein [Salmonella enterica subsp. enterica serovar Oranienburg]|uniref:Protein TonB n=1 Tax=Salmonella enterica TaxID=28901 RepID=A0A743TVS9_SALER|nr:hypothetical protein [Salmonella enterica subsp. enterica serovar Oranienburg]ECI9603851.1 TonB family protein [Salmonella enterica]EBY8947462.1 TonB family protein [Salmonella enterica subsp. enterica serovar Oranienburg]HAF1420304.1 TonB family protein [Salmonella enterica]HAF2206554.1 TonB family protein [Salmonella enterica]